jgi:magnesium transporter
LEVPRVDYIYLSNLLNKRVLSSDGRILGRIKDLVVNVDLHQPEAVMLVFQSRMSRDRQSVPWEAVERVLPNEVTLKVNSVPQPMPPKDSLPSSNILLRDFLLDKQIVDVHGAKVERVNDLQFVKSDGRLLLLQVDVGMRGILRRLGWEDLVARFFTWFFDYNLKEQFIAWNYVQPLSDPDRLKLQIPQSKLAELHPADLADIIEDMDVHERAAIVESLNEDVVADIMEEMDPKVQVSIMRGLEPEKAADILEEMSPDDAADLIADLPQETVRGIFQEMDDDYQEQVKVLLAHEEDEAGGMMTTQFMALPSDKTIVDALAHIRQHADEVDVIYYIYVVDRESKLLGVVNLRELLSHEIFTPLERIMTTRLITAKIDDEAEDLADLFGKYGFRAIPVLDDEGRIKGVIRFKALMEILAPHLGR